MLVAFHGSQVLTCPEVGSHRFWDVSWRPSVGRAGNVYWQTPDLQHEPMLPCVHGIRIPKATQYVNRTSTLYLICGSPSTRFPGRAKPRYSKALSPNTQSQFHEAPKTLSFCLAFLSLCRRPSVGLQRTLLITFHPLANRQPGYCEPFFIWSMRRLVACCMPQVLR
jgi:hypothetical protein